MALTISRSDVISDYLCEYQKDSRFLKLDSSEYLNLLNIDPLPSQIALLNAVNNPKYRFVCGALSRRQGKTYISNIIGQLTCLVPGAHVLLMSPNYALRVS